MGDLITGEIMYRGDFAIVKNGKYTHKGKEYQVVIKEISNKCIYGENELRMLQIIRLVDPKAKIHMRLFCHFKSQSSQVLVIEKADMDLSDYYVSDCKVLHCLSRHMYQIIKILIQFHKFGIVHCDLKPENIVGSSGWLKFIDFGGSIIANREEKYHVNTTKPHLFDKKKIGTPGYQHPSIYKKTNYNLFAQDIWSVLMTAASLGTSCLFAKDEHTPDVAWQTAFWNGSWSDEILCYKPVLQDDPNWFLFVGFIDNLVQFSKLDYPCASSELLQDPFLQVWRK
jgi:serine/threonine protein kinase